MVTSGLPIAAAAGVERYACSDMAGRLPVCGGALGQEGAGSLRGMVGSSRLAPGQLLDGEVSEGPGRCSAASQPLLL